MAVAYSNVTQPGLLAQQYPPPLLPKPGKDNARLQKLLKKTAKKKTSVPTAQSAAPFRSSLSPVNEASPDLEHSDHATPPKTPEMPLYGVPQHPRFTVRPLYQHVPSPYPHRAYGRAARFSPQTVAAPSYFFPQHVTPSSSYPTPARPAGVSPTLEPVTQAMVPRISVSASYISEVTIPAVTLVATPQPKLGSPVPTPFTTTGSRAVIRPLTVLTPLVKSKSPHPTFKATECSRSPKPMFDVPQIRMYTAITSYYETSRIPPVYDTAGLTSIGTLTPTPEIKRGTTPTTEVKRGLTPTSEIKRSTTPTGESNRVITPTSEIQRAKTPTYEFATSRTLSGRPKTPSYHVTRATTPVFEISRTNPLLFAVSPITVEPEKSKTPVSSLPTSQSVKMIVAKPAKTISNDQCTLNGDIHSDITPEPPAAKSTQESMSKSAQQEDAAPQLTRETTPTAPLGYQRPKTPTSDPIKPMVTSYDVQRPKTPTSDPIKPMVTSYGIQRPKTPTSDPIKPMVTSYGVQRPKTPTYEASRLMTTVTGYQRAKTPTYRASPSGTSPVAFQRPKTPTQPTQKSKSAYRGLTPAEYVAYGGIQSYSPAYGFSKSHTSTQEEVQITKEASEECQEASVKIHSLAEVSKVEETQKKVDKPHLRDDKVSTSPVVVLPSIVVSQASDISETPSSSHETSKISSQLAATQEQTVTQETPKVKPPTAEVKTPEKEKVKTPVQEFPKPKTPEAKRRSPAPVRKGGSQVPLTATTTLVVKDKVQTAEQVTETETKAGVSQQKQLAQPSAPTETKVEGSKPSTATAPAKDIGPPKPVVPVKASAESTVTVDKVEKAVTAPEAKSAPEKKEGDDSPPAAEALLKAIQKPKGMKSKLSGWSRLKKHMVVEQEEPKFPELDSQKEAPGQDQGEAKKCDEKADEKAGEKSGEKAGDQEENQSADAPKATKMWNAVLFQMFSTKENIMHQIELNKSEEEKTAETMDEPKEVPAFAHRLPVLLFSPRFDAKKLREAASRPLTKISTVFEMGLIGRKNKDEEPKDFNRTARGFTAP